jgi:hypothetical protein
MAIPIKEFAYKKQGPIDGLVNGLLNAVITYFLLSGFDKVPIMSPPGGDFSHSLMGSLLLPAIVIAFAISLMTTNATIKKRLKGDVEPRLESKVSWTKAAITRGLGRAILNVLLVYGVGGIIVQFSPDFEISRLAASFAVLIMAGGIAYMESVSATLRTLKLG